MTPSPSTGLNTIFQHHKVTTDEILAISNANDYANAQLHDKATCPPFPSPTRLQLTNACIRFFKILKERRSRNLHLYCARNRGAA
jgi:hypothetical protein